ncbi:MAG: TRAP transporter large permease subunit [Desulfobacteraceae bacterium]|nr:TRAP transporter large permease subunit [Desulfobacteraceae bacterium]
METGLAVIISLLVIMFIFMFMGVPIAIALGISTTINLIIFTDMNFMFIAQNMYSALNNYAILAVPFFILASNIMVEAGISKRLMELAEAFTAGITGGLGIAGVMACAIFAAISGSSSATVIAIGSILIPGMVEAGYDKRFATALIACSGSLGILIPPSILMIIFAVLADVSVGKLFAAGMLPGVLLTIFLMIYVYIISKKRRYPKSPPMPFKRRVTTVVKNFPSLSVPIIILGGIYSGIVTPTESAVVAIALGFFIGFLVYKELKIRDLPKIFLRSAEMSSMILLIFGFAYSFGWLLALFEVPDTLSQIMLDSGMGPLMFLLWINVILFFAGDFMDPGSIMIIFTPLIVVLATALDINLIHMGIVVTMNLEIGLITPPVGFNLYVGSSLSKLPLYDVMKAAIPVMIIIGIALVLITYIPSISVFLPKLIFGSV